MQDRTGLTVFLVRVVFVLFETRRFCKVARFVFPDLSTIHRAMRALFFLLTILKSDAGRKLAESTVKGQSSIHMLALICRSGEVSPLMTAMRRM